MFVVVDAKLRHRIPRHGDAIRQMLDRDLPPSSGFKSSISAAMRGKAKWTLSDSLYSMSARAERHVAIAAHEDR